MTTQQTDLFGNPVTTPTPARPGQPDSNDIDLLLTIAANAIRCGYLLVGVRERVYARTDSRGEVARVPRYEEDAVHQLLRRRWLSRGSPHPCSCGSAWLLGTAVLVPKSTREQLTRWERLRRPPHWPHATPSGPGGPAANSSGRVARLDDHRRTR